MFRKFKDKLAEEVKSSPQRIQQFAQAAQAAVTSASSSISDITNSDLFSIGDNENPQHLSNKTITQNSESKNKFHNVPLGQPTSTESMDLMTGQDLDIPRQRRLSNSSFASDVSFRLPNYETPSMYHLQSDMEISASEAEERSFSAGNVSLDGVTKEQLYAAYKRTQDRYKKYRTQYGDLARHYKLLERENAKARSVLVETQDKALRRISELKEQCSLEQSAKAHLEKALRIELDEKNMKIDSLNTTMKLLQNSSQGNPDATKNKDSTNNVDNNEQLINLSNDDSTKQNNDLEKLVSLHNNKMEKMDQLLSKYKESLKVSKDKNSQLANDLKVLSNELDKKNKEYDELHSSLNLYAEAKQKIRDLSDLNEELQNKINSYDFNKSKTISNLELDLQKANEEIGQLRSKIEVFGKREEEYAISLAENKLSIHKELESKESEIKSLKDGLSANIKEIQSLNIIIDDYKNKVTFFEAENLKLSNESKEVNYSKNKIAELESQLQEFIKKTQSLEQVKTKADEEYKCLQLQFKQETAEKLAMIDRNTYLENRNSQLVEENTKKTSQIVNLEQEISALKEKTCSDNMQGIGKDELLRDINLWKNKYEKLQFEIQEERDELVKLQLEIEKLLKNHELLRSQNVEYQTELSKIKSENIELEKQLTNYKIITSNCYTLANKISKLRDILSSTSDEIKSLIHTNKETMSDVMRIVSVTLNSFNESETDAHVLKYNDLQENYSKLQVELHENMERYEETTKQLGILKNVNESLKSEALNVVSDNAELNERNKYLTSQYECTLENLNLLTKENEKLVKELDCAKREYKDLLEAHEFKSSQITNETIKELSILRQETDNLKCELLERTSENSILNENILNITSLYEKSLDDIDFLKKQNLDLVSAVESSKREYINLLEECDLEKSNHLRTTETLVLTQNEKQKLINEKKSLENTNIALNTEIQQIKKHNEIVAANIDLANQDKNDLENDLQTLKNKVITMHQLEDSVRALTEENIYLKTQTEAIKSNVIQLESEISSIRKSHTQIQEEKDHLSKIIESLEDVNNKVTTHNTSCKDTQTEKNIKDKKADSIDNLLDIENENDIKYHSLKVEYDVIKEENRRLQSDIEGLQNYLTKISKENSTLNDNIRELIATSDHSGDTPDTTMSLSNLKKELEIGKERLNDLLRENTLLVEENLELKDQLQSHNFTNSTIKSVERKENYMTQENISLEKRVLDLEQVNKSLNANMLQVQEKNEKLKLSNEKLETRLDEALVSLRHLHSLQENTELEYLRNILYEYLTGTGAHSVTLAKVLAAIVKFDELQTQLVLQKEKERQGFLRQLGII